MATSSSGEPSYDYTEGASAIDIQQAIASSARARRDSRYGDDGEAVFDGPGHSVNPSSISRMTLRDHSRRSSGAWSRGSMSRRRSEESISGERPSRRRQDSRESEVSYGSTDNGRHVDHDGNDDLHVTDEDEEGHGMSTRRSRPKSLSPQHTRNTVFDNIASMFGRHASVTESPTRSRRPSTSSRTSRSRLLRRQSSSRSDAGSDYAIETEDEGDERWGYSSGEEDTASEEHETDVASMAPSELEYGSYPPSPGPSLPLMSGDPIFGSEARIDINELELLSPPPPGPPSRQTLYVVDEDAHIRMIGCEPIRWRLWLWRLCCVLSFGVLALLGQWFPRMWLRWVTHEKALVDIKNGFVVVEGYCSIPHLQDVLSLSYIYGVLVPNRSICTTTSVPSSRCMVRAWRDSTWTGIASVQGGLSKAVQSQRHALFGPNIVDIEGKSTMSLLIDEIIHPFYVFQIASITLWSLDDYYYYAFCIALISALSILSTLVETKQTIARMREMSKFTCAVKAFRDGAWSKCDSSDLVPGDVVDLVEPALTTLPADIFLLSGDAIVNESMLTGESVPVSKIPAKNEDLVRWKDDEDVNHDSMKSFLYAGTRVVRIRGALTVDGRPGTPALGLVVRTGFNTTKGALIRSMLFPKPMGFKFYRDSIRFILVLTGIAGFGFCASAVQFVRLGVKWHTILLRALDLITVVVPPALPATLSIGTSFAIGRLRKSGIFCISPSRVKCSWTNQQRNTGRFGELIEDIHDLPGSGVKASFLYALATCHSLKMVDGEVIGDPLDVKMFEFTNWMLEEGHVAGAAVVKSRAGGDRPAALVQTVVRPPGSARFRVEDALKGAGRHAHFLELGVIRTFEFVSALRRMSVIVKRLKSTSMEIYVKGAPEVMGDICDRRSFPQDYDDLLSYYTKRGYRVIAMAGKSMEGLSWLRAQKLKREQVETDLQFLGLIIFENKLKPGTTPAIQALRSAHFACRMITGDNPLTAVSVARECGLINPAAQVFSPVFIRGNATMPLSKLEWASMDEPSWKLDDYSLKPLPRPLLI
ncbi:hypothetical protein A0H81_12899 [Grifola frondosa]|uniref:Cation-transporting ATPase n=1 Tax=Grifola frondosa TaxID=5627 RepID=A0A1C7LQX4_GRIFR|nr:hypothetical protein A0H81_12899 [Grifola frondosa]